MNLDRVKNFMWWLGYNTIINRRIVMLRWTRELRRRSAPHIQYAFQGWSLLFTSDIETDRPILELRFNQSLSDEEWKFLFHTRTRNFNYYNYSRSVIPLTASFAILWREMQESYPECVPTATQLLTDVQVEARGFDSWINGKLRWIEEWAQDLAAAYWPFITVLSGLGIVFWLLCAGIISCDRNNRMEQAMAEKKAEIVMVHDKSWCTTGCSPPMRPLRWQVDEARVCLCVDPNVIYQNENPGGVTGVLSDGGMKEAPLTVEK